MNVLGISFGFHDASAALVQNGILVSATTEERFSRKKHDPQFPFESIRWCLSHNKLDFDDIDLVVFHESARAKFVRVISQHCVNYPSSFSLFRDTTPSWLGGKLLRKDMVRGLGYTGDIAYVNHHAAHAASAFYASGYHHATILTIDGLGEWDSATIGRGGPEGIRIIEAVGFPDSIGLFYSAMTTFLGFQANESEYKVMGLASFGTDETLVGRYYALLDQTMKRSQDGSFKLDMRYFSFDRRERMWTDALERLLGGRPRFSGEITENCAALAQAVQKITEEVVLSAAMRAHEIVGNDALVFAGGVALNCSANERIAAETSFKRIYIHPAAGDAGCAVGAAFLGAHGRGDLPRSIGHPYLGRAYSEEAIQESIRTRGLSYERLSSKRLIQRTVKHLDEQRVVGWYQGASEWGPRALGNRSIIADPRKAGMRDRVNQAIKFREPFRPFAPAILASAAGRYFEIESSASDLYPYMLATARAKREAQQRIPATVHIDGTSRIQLVTEETNRLFHDLLVEWHRTAEVPVLLNTSFNRRGEPIVDTPDDAIDCFLKTDIDVLVMGPFLITKETQNAKE